MMSLSLLKALVELTGVLGRIGFTCGSYSFAAFWTRSHLSINEERETLELYTYVHTINNNKNSFKTIWRFRSELRLKPVKKTTFRISLQMWRWKLRQESFRNWKCSRKPVHPYSSLHRGAGLVTLTNDVCWFHPGCQHGGKPCLRLVQAERLIDQRE